MTQIKPLTLRALQKVPAPRATRKITMALTGIFFLLPILLTTVPWRQNVTARGRVTALNPLDRTQVIPAPVTGRLVDVKVREGARVKKGDVLVEMADQDPFYSARLQQQFGFTRDELRAATSTVEFYDQQLIHLEDVREQAISSASFELNIAIEKVRSSERDLEALEAELDQKRADRERKSTLWTTGVVSELDFQKAEASYLSARAKVEGAKAKVEQARNQEKSKMALISKVTSEQLAKIESTKSTREGARSKVAASEKKLNDATTKLERQKTQVVLAPRDGTILRVHAANSADLLSKGDPLIEFVPHAEELAVELWVRGVDAPLVMPGRKVRLQFEGWPAVQIAGWPSVAAGTFGGEITVVDSYGNANGEFRVLVLPDSEDEAWPERSYLRQGVRANGWLMLDTVTLGYEFWRQLNAFPPSVDKSADGSFLMPGSKSGEKKKSGGKEKK